MTENNSNSLEFDNDSEIQRIIIENQLFSGIPELVFVPEKLGLIVIHFIITSETLEDLEFVEMAIQEHPYKMNIFRIYVTEISMYVRFISPKNSLYHILLFFMKLKKLHKITNYTLNLSLNRFTYSSSHHKENFNYMTWFEEKKEIVIPEREQLEIPLLTKLHLEIIKLLSIDPSMSLYAIKLHLHDDDVEILKAYELVNQHLLYPKVKMENNTLKGHNKYLLRIFNKNEEDAISLFSSIKNNPLPFNVSIDMCHDHTIYFWCEATPNEMVKFFKALWSFYPDVELLILDFKYGKYQYFWLEPENFDFVNQKWRNDAEFMILKPMERLIARKLFLDGYK
ncbi:MAG: hypothetical protein INQ03_08200 [Candidatus Heimdallarchaeota archaeon]|nr:hypothetical protein [Candidatus Heimdallarchaeota archaeon]